MFAPKKRQTFQKMAPLERGTQFVGLNGNVELATLIACDITSWNVDGDETLLEEDLRCQVQEVKYQRDKLSKA
jgi:hypothetical protein